MRRIVCGIRCIRPSGLLAWRAFGKFGRRLRNVPADLFEFILVSGVDELAGQDMGGEGTRTKQANLVQTSGSFAAVWIGGFGGAFDTFPLFGADANTTVDGRWHGIRSLLGLPSGVGAWRCSDGIDSGRGAPTPVVTCAPVPAFV